MKFLRAIFGKKSVDDADATVTAQVAAASDISKPHQVAHYLYFPTSEGAKAVASKLQERGFLVERRLGADGVNWLVLAKHEIVIDDTIIASLRELMQRVVAPFHGDYDGWEVDMGQSDLPPPTQH